MNCRTTFKPLLLAACAMASGCTSLNAAQTANTMGKGGMQFALEPSYANWDGFSFPRMDLALRYGVTDSIDIGGKIGSSFAEINGKFQLTDPTSDGFVASIAPSVGGIQLGASSNGSSSTAGLINLAVPVLLGIKVGEGSQLVLGPRLQDFLVNASSSSGSTSTNGLANVLGVGTSVGFAGKITDGFRIMPELGFVIPVVGSARASSSNGSTSSTTDAFKTGAVFWQLGLTFLFGQYHQPAHVEPGPAPMPSAPPSSAPPVQSAPPASAPPPPPNYPQ